MKLSIILNDVTYSENINKTKFSVIEIEGIAFDSRRVKKDYIFFAISGFSDDGSKYIDQALELGAICIVSQNKIENLPSHVDNILVKDVREALAICARNFYSNPSSKMKMFSVTGTNGKTSVSWITAQLISLLGEKSMYIGTLGTYFFTNGEPECILGEGRTSPDSLYLNQSLSEALSKGVKFSAIEVTSHALTQSRTTGIDWDSSSFTNLTQDHLDYHGTMEKYGEAKSRLFFDELRRSKKIDKTSIINIDNNFGEDLAKKIENDNFCKLIKFSIVNKNHTKNTLYVESITSTNNISKISYKFNDKNFEVDTKLLGDFNISNLTLSLATLISLGYHTKDFIHLCIDLKSVPGRMELLTSKDNKRVFVDYSHTPDSLEKAQACIRKILDDEFKLTKIKGKLITIFGCGGDRDKTKRPLMAKAVQQGSDTVVVTSDNPRTEEPGEIIKDIVAGFSNNFKDYLIEVEREKAIKEGIRLLRSEDILLLAGKGHEDYQEVMGIKYPFDDRVKVREYFEEQLKNK